MAAHPSNIGKVETLGVTVHVNVRLLEVLNDNEVREWVGPGRRPVGNMLLNMSEHRRVRKMHIICIYIYIHVCICVVRCFFICIYIYIYTRIYA